MLTPIQFNNDTALKTYKIYNVRADRMLSSEFESLKTFGSQIIPKVIFGVCSPFPQTFCKRNELLQIFTPSLTLPPPAKAFCHQLINSFSLANGLLRVLLGIFFGGNPVFGAVKG